MWLKCDSRTASSLLDRSDATFTASRANSSSSQPWAMARLEAVGTGQRVYHSSLTVRAGEVRLDRGIVRRGCRGQAAADSARSRTRGMTSVPKRTTSASSGWNCNMNSSMPAAENAAIRSATWS